MRDQTSRRVKLKDRRRRNRKLARRRSAQRRRIRGLLGRLCERLLSSGIPVSRVAIFVHTLHPQIMGRRFLWRQGERTKVSAAPYTMADDDIFLTSPVYRVRKTGETIRRRLCDPISADDFPILSELREEGVTEYFAAPLHFTNGEIHVAAFTTNADGGFSRRRIRQSHIPPRAFGPHRRGSRAAPHRDQSARRLCRTRRRRKNPLRQDFARRQRANPRGDLAIRHARLHQAHRSVCRRSG